MIIGQTDCLIVAPTAKSDRPSTAEIHDCHLEAQKFLGRRCGKYMNVRALNLL
jgi:hypothetical protein